MLSLFSLQKLNNINIISPVCTKRKIESVRAYFLFVLNENLLRPACLFTIAVGGGGAGGAVAPPFGSKRRKSSKIRANGLFIWANSLDIGAHHCQNTVSVSVQTFFFFFFGEHLNLDRKTVQISGKTFFFFFFFFFGEHLNLGRKNRLNFDRETQCIKSFFGQKFAAPPNHFELLRPCSLLCSTILLALHFILQTKKALVRLLLYAKSGPVISIAGILYKKCLLSNIHSA